MIDNFDIHLKNLSFESDFDRYAVHILKRTKDQDGRIMGSNETQRFLRTYYVHSKEYLESKMQAIKYLCDDNNARAYILPQVRDNKKVMKNLAILAIQNEDNPTVKLDKLTRKAFCGFHESRRKRFILDLDDDNMTEYIKGEPRIGGHPKITIKVWTPNEVLNLVKLLIDRGDPKYKSSDVYMVPTRNGNCIVTPPINMVEAQKRCGLMFTGRKQMVTDYLDDGFLPGTMTPKFIPVTNKFNGWVIHDGMSLLYCDL